MKPITFTVTMLVMLASCNRQPPARPDLQVTVAETPNFLGTKQTEVIATWTNRGTVRILIGRKYGVISPETDLTTVSYTVYFNCRQLPSLERTCAVSRNKDEFLEVIKEAQQREIIKFKRR
jgi:hypothetical protein